MKPRETIVPRESTKPMLRTGRLLVEATCDRGSAPGRVSVDPPSEPRFSMVSGDGRIPYVDLEGDRRVQVAFQPDGVRVLMDDICASVLTDGTIACTVGKSTVTMIEGSVRVVDGNGAVMTIASIDDVAGHAGTEAHRDGIDAGTGRVPARPGSRDGRRGRPSYTLDEFSNDHLVDDGGRLRRPTASENAMIVDGIVKFLSRFGIRDTTSMPDLGDDGHAAPSDLAASPLLSRETSR